MAVAGEGGAEEEEAGAGEEQAGAEEEQAGAGEEEAGLVGAGRGRPQPGSEGK